MNKKQLKLYVGPGTMEDIQPGSVCEGPVLINSAAIWAFSEIRILLKIGLGEWSRDPKKTGIFFNYVWKEGTEQFYMTLLDGELTLCKAEER